MAYYESCTFNYFFAFLCTNSSGTNELHWYRVTKRKREGDVNWKEIMLKIENTGQTHSASQGPSKHHKGISSSHSAESTVLYICITYLNSLTNSQYPTILYTELFIPLQRVVQTLF